MMNETGLFAWGEFEGEKPFQIKQIRTHFALCWEQPFAKWVTLTTFVVKVSTKQTIYPLLAIDFEHGFQIIPNSSDLNSRPSNVVASDLTLERWQSQDEILVALK
jgi:hypothetical protein